MSNTVKEKESQPFTLKLMHYALLMQNVCPMCLIYAFFA